MLGGFYHVKALSFQFLTRSTIVRFPTLRQYPDGSTFALMTIGRLAVRSPIHIKAVTADNIKRA